MLILVRHGESVWNKKNIFTGWTDVELTKKGINQAKKAGKELKKMDVTIDVAYTSYLSRAKDTLDYMLKEMKQLDVEIIESWKLNERHYGFLQGFNKSKMADICGKELVHNWRRSLYLKPPALTLEDKRYPGNDIKYSGITSLPLTESLNDTIERALEIYNSEIIKKLEMGQNVLVVAHGNSLRGLMKYLDNISNEEIENLEIDYCKLYIYNK